MPGPDEPIPTQAISDAVALATVVTNVGWMRESMKEQGESLKRIEQTLSALPQTYVTKADHNEIKRVLERVDETLTAMPRNYVTKTEHQALDNKVDEVRKFVWKASGAIAILIILAGIIDGVRGGVHIP